MNENITEGAPEADTAALFPGSDREAVELRSWGGTRADEQGLVDVAHRTIDTPVGTLLLAATRTGLVRVAFEREGFEHVLQTLADKIGPRVLNAPKRLDPVARELEEYFAG